MGELSNFEFPLMGTRRGPVNEIICLLGLLFETKMVWRTRLKALGNQWKKWYKGNLETQV